LQNRGTGCARIRRQPSLAFAFLRLAGIGFDHVRHAI